MNRIRMKMNVIFIPYCSFATSGLSELWIVSRWCASGRRRVVHESKHLSADGKWQRENQEHEKRHLRHQEEEDLHMELATGW